MFTRTKYLTFLASALTLLLTTTACEKETNQTPPAPKNPSSSFSLRDSIKIESKFQTQDPAFFQRYNGQTHVVTSTNKLSLQTMEMNYSTGTGTMETDLAIIFIDSSVLKPHCIFEVALAKTKHTTLKANYDLTDLSQARIRSVQTFSDGSIVQMDNFSVLSGSLRMIYDPAGKSVSGEIINLKLPLWFYVGENVTDQIRTQNAARIQAGGSTRTIQLKFDNIKVQ